MSASVDEAVDEVPRLQVVSVGESSLCNFDRSDDSALIKVDPLWVIRVVLSAFGGVRSSPESDHTGYGPERSLRCAEGLYGCDNGNSVTSTASSCSWRKIRSKCTEGYLVLIETRED